MSEENQETDINKILEPVDIDLDKLFSLSYTFDNLKSFMKNIIKNQQIIADKINELEKKSVLQNDENKRFHIFQSKIDKKLKIVENNVNKNKKALENIKSNVKEEEPGLKVIEEKDVTESEEKEENKKANKKRESKVKRKSTDMENQFSFNEYSDEKDEDYYNYENMASNKDITEIKQRLDDFEQQINDLNQKVNQRNNNALTFKPTDFTINDSHSDIDLIKLEIKNLKENNETFKIQTDSIKKKMEDISVKVMDFDVFDVFRQFFIEELPDVCINTVSVGYTRQRVLINCIIKFHILPSHVCIGIEIIQQKQ